MVERCAFHPHLENLVEIGRDDSGGVGGRHARELLREVAHVQLARDARHEGCGHALFRQRHPVQAAEEWVLLELQRVVLAATQALARVLDQQLGDQVLDLEGEAVRNGRVGLEDAPAKATNEGSTSAKQSRKGKGAAARLRLGRQYCCTSAP